MRMSYPPAEGLASPEIEIAESGTMLDNKGKFNDLKAMLDSNKENVKMDAMRRIINMVARGKDVSELFPAVVKNVAAKNLELKKLVYVYLVRYAEEQQDLALLSISTFQRGLKDPNQLIRASALRVLSSIRVQMIAPVMMLAIKESVRDMSPYVRKVAAHAIPKLYALDSELQSSLIECIDFLLGDKRTLVLGSAVYAFEQTCPDRLDLLHRHFRLLCRALTDIDEWGQIIMIGLLTRYARTQFLSPFANERNRSLEKSKEENENDQYPQPLDPDHNLLLTSVRPLLQSRNPAVVMAVSQLLYYIAPHSQLSVVPRALVRLLRGPNEIQYIILVNIASICVNTARQQQDREVFAISKNLFEPFLKSFFIRSFEPIHVKQLKLQVLTSLVTEANVQLVIRELQAYMQMIDLADAAIDAIGRCALQVPSAADSCLATLIQVISSNGTPEQVVCASVVVLKRLLHSDAPLPLLKRVFRLIDNVKAPMARACILWLIGMHIEKVPKLAPDLLRKVTSTFCDEAESVKLQALNLAVRLWVIDPANREGKCALLLKYIFQLARFDRSYDIRDRCRFLRNFLFGPSASNEKEIDENGEEERAKQNGQSENNDDGMVKFPLEIFLSERPAPVVQNTFADRVEHFQLGTLSHLLNQKCSGYTELPDFPSEQPDPTIRRSAYPLPNDSPKTKPQKIDAEEEFTSFEEEDDEESEEDEDEEEEEKSDEDEEEEDEDSVEEEEEEEEMNKSDKERKIQKTIEKVEEVKKQRTNNDGKKDETKESQDDLLLLDLDFGPPIMSTSSSSALPAGIMSKWTRASAQWVPDEFSLHLVPSVVSGGLTVNGRFCRSPCLFSSSMVCLELQINFRHSQLRTSDVQLNPTLPSNLLTSGPLKLTGLGEGERRRITVGIDFMDSAQTSEWTVQWENGEKRARFQVRAPYGEQLEPIEISSEIFLEKRTKLTGMNKVQKGIGKAPDSFTARQLFKICNCKQIISLKFCFAAQTISCKELVLISFLVVDDEENWCLQINCENVAFASILAQELAQRFDI